MDLVPGGPELLPGNKLNLWRGYGVEACKGDWPLMQQHIKRILADGISEACDYITRYAAWIVQNPGERPGVALVLRGGEGTGKGVFLRCLLREFGAHGSLASSTLTCTRASSCLRMKPIGLATKLPKGN